MTQSIPAVQFFLQCFKECRRFISGQRDSLSTQQTEKIFSEEHNAEADGGRHHQTFGA